MSDHFDSEDSRTDLTDEGRLVGPDRCHGCAHYVELLTPDHDSWAGYEWLDRSGQLERRPRKQPGSG